MTLDATEAPSASEVTVAVTYELPRLVLAAENSRKRVVLDGEMLVGRDPSCAIPINSLHISRYHAKISQTPEGFFVEDLNSANGTYINGLKLTGKCVLQIGDLVCFDDQGFRILAEGQTEPSSQLLARTGATPAITEAQLEQAAQARVAEPPKDAQETLLHPNDAENLAPEPISLSQETAVLDTTRTLTYHEMKQLLNWSAAQEQAIAAKQEEPRFVVHTPPMAGKEIPLTGLDVDARWKIGCDLTSKICLRDKSILVDHAYVSRNPSGYRLTATSAARSFMLNGIPLRDSYLRQGDRIQLGRIDLEYRTEVANDAPVSAVTPNNAAEPKGKAWGAWITAAFILAVVVGALILGR
jgi:pSer/pThr/pTyr-binding forkhead associated (FHA) protein